jgi:hypothetical protein
MTDPADADPPGVEPAEEKPAEEKPAEAGPRRRRRLRRALVETGVIIAVAVLLCSSAVTAIPASSAAKRFDRPAPRTRRRLEP